MSRGGLSGVKFCELWLALFWRATCARVVRSGGLTLNGGDLCVRINGGLALLGS